jgi:PTS system nitrogen regulatory IIA component
VKLCELFTKKVIIPELKATQKNEAIEELLQAIKKGCKGERFSVSSIVEAIVKREKLGSTGIGGGVGVPHAKLPGIKNLLGAFGRTSTPIDFNAVDGEPVQLIFVILAPEAKSAEYLEMLKAVMTAIKRPNAVRFLKAARTVKEIETVFREVEEVPV